MWYKADEVLPLVEFSLLVTPGYNWTLKIDVC